MTHDKELMDCPFCGAAGEIITDAEGYKRPRCTICNCQLGLWPGENGHQYAEKAWNTRHRAEPATEAGLATKLRLHTDCTPEGMLKYLAASGHLHALKSAPPETEVELSEHPNARQQNMFSALCEISKAYVENRPLTKHEHAMVSTIISAECFELKKPPAAPSEDLMKVKGTLEMILNNYEMDDGLRVAALTDEQKAKGLKNGLIFDVEKALEILNRMTKP